MPILGERAATSTVGLMVFGASVLSGTAILALMLDTTNEYQEQARVATGSATDSLHPSVQVRGLSGQRLAGSLGLDRLLVLVSPAPGAGKLPLTGLVVQLTTPEGQASFALGEPPEGFTYTAFIDQEPRLDPAAPEVSSGDIVQLTLDPRGAGVRLEPRTPATLLFLAPPARAERLSFTVPASVAGRDFVELHGDPASGRWTIGRLSDP